MSEVFALWGENLELDEVQFRFFYVGCSAKTISMSLIVVGSMAYDAIETPFGQTD